MFRFPLEAVLTMRKRDEEICQLSLAQAVRQEITLQEQAAGLEKVRLAEAGELMSLERTGLKVGDYLLRRWRLDDLRTRLQAARNQLEECREEIRKRRLLLLEATKKRKMVERLREKALESHQAQVRRQETKLIDDFAVLARARRG